MSAGPATAADQRELPPECTFSWEETKRKARERRIAAGLPVPTAEEKQAATDRLAAEVRAYQLAEVRRDQALTQRDVAMAMGVSAPRVSAIEHGEVDRTEVATLRSYVEALGGRLRVVADFGDTEYTVA
ncbi:helix-turn-helix domain-containing protein [Streptomyces bobili]|uniref:XRE family transcriptional regulator n=1 Tax=Streptomyces bobili TaxID=67280 RepID=UPI00225B9D06|nr:XRE family transcriptional regulator [Streptomyces bobili]MCX5526267.1 helix-turn-helix domain-containing protein [Streptomyces bobili]